jgi:hypothetical protein
MREIYILSAVGMTASVVNDRQTNNVGGNNETEHIIDPQLSSQAKKDCCR